MPIDPHLVGMLAGLLTTAAFVPQAVSIWRTKNADGVSIPMYCIFLVGIGLWLAYGVMLGSIPIIFYYSITFAMASAILAMKLKFG